MARPDRDALVGVGAVQRVFRRPVAQAGEQAAPGSAAAPDPAAGAALTLAQLRALLRKVGRTRGTDTEALRLRDALRVPQMRQLPLVEQAMGRIPRTARTPPG